MVITSKLNPPLFPKADWNRSQCQILRQHTACVHSISISRDGHKLISVGNNTICIWDIASGIALKTIKDPQDWFYAVDISPDGNNFATGSRKQVKWWDTNTGELQSLVKGHFYWIWSVAYSPDQTHLASGCDKSVRLWNLESGQREAILEDARTIFRIPLLSELNAARSLAYSPDGQYLASGGSEKVVKIWDPVTGNLIAILRGHSHSVSSVTFSPDGRQLISASWDCSIRVWEWRTGVGSLLITGHTDYILAVAISADAELIASGSRDKTVRLWNAKTGISLAILQGHNDWVMSVAFLPDGNGLASASADTTIRIWTPMIDNLDHISSDPSNLLLDWSNSPAAAFGDRPPPYGESPFQPTHPIASDTVTPSTEQLDPSPKTALSEHELIPTVVSHPNPSEPVDQEADSISLSTSIPTGSENSALVHETDLSSLPNTDAWIPFMPVGNRVHGKYRRKTTTPQGYGGFSDVWICDILYSNQTTQVAALKELRAVNIVDSSSGSETSLRRMLARLEREVLVWATLDHPRITPLLGYRFQPTMCLLSPWYQNGNVKRYLLNHPTANKRKLIRQIAEGLVYLHSMNPPIVHGDLKSDNVLISDEGNAVINDFGLSRAFEDVSGFNTTTSTTGIGNPRWLAPELYCEDGCKRSTETDVYAFGCVSLEIYTGALPYRELSDIRVTLALANGKPPVSDVSIYPELAADDPLWNLLFDCWREEPGKRPTMKEVEENIHQVGETQ